MTVVHYGSNINPHTLWESILLEPTQRVGIDTETMSVSDITMLGLGLAPTPDDGFYITPDDPDFNLVVSWLQSTDVSKIYHNAPFDLRVLRDYSPNVDNVDDTAMMARLYPEHSAVLEDCSFWVQRQTQSMSHVFAEHGVSRVVDLPFEVLAKKCCQDAMATRALYDYYAERIDMEYYNWLRPMFGILTKISQQGIRLDQGRLQELNAHYGQKIMKYRQLCQAQGFKVSSPQQVGHYLALRGNFLPLTRKGGQLISDDEHLTKLQDPMAHVILEYRHASKMESTYIRPFLGKERAYTTLRMEAGTGRVNSTNAGKDQPDRNLQNIPKQAEKGDIASVRGAFIPDNGMFTKIDQSQAELRILAVLSKDPEMQALFERGEDIHQWVVDRTNLSRTHAKNLNFGLMYGGDVQTIADFLHMSDLSHVQGLMDMYKEMFPQAWDWFLEMEELGISQGYVTTLKGRKLGLPTEQGEKHMHNSARCYPIQGTAAESIFELMMDPEILQHLDITRLQIHDELILDGYVEIEGMAFNPDKSTKSGYPTYDIQDRLAHLSGFYLPMEVQIVERWG